LISEFQDIELEETFNPSPVRSPRPLDDPRYRHLFVDKNKKGRPRQGDTEAFQGASSASILTKLLRLY
jgi:hypothetical protein